MTSAPTENYGFAFLEFLMSSLILLTVLGTVVRFQLNIKRVIRQSHATYTQYINRKEELYRQMHSMACKKDEELQGIRKVTCKDDKYSVTFFEDADERS